MTLRPTLALLALLAAPAWAGTYFEAPTTWDGAPFDQATALELSGDGKTIYVAAQGLDGPSAYYGALVVVRQEDGVWRQRQVLRRQIDNNELARVLDLELSADGRFLYVASGSDVLVFAADPATGVLTQIQAVLVGNSAARRLELVQDGSRLVLLQQEGLATLAVNTGTGQVGAPVFTSLADGDIATFQDFLAISPDERFVVLGGDPAIQVFSLNGPTLAPVAKLDDIVAGGQDVLRTEAMSGFRTSGELYVKDDALATVRLSDAGIPEVLGVVSLDGDVPAHAYTFDLAIDDQGRVFMLTYGIAEGETHVYVFAPPPGVALDGPPEATYTGRIGSEAFGPTAILPLPGGAVDFLAAGLDSYPLEEITLDEEGGSVSNPLLPRSVGPEKLVFASPFLHAMTPGSATLSVLERRGLGLEGEFFEPVGTDDIPGADLAISADGLRAAILQPSYFSTSRYLLYDRDPATGDLRRVDAETLQWRSGGLAFSPDGRFLYASPQNYWRITLAGLEPVLPMVEDDAPNSTSNLDISPNGRILVHTGRTAAERSWWRRDPATGATTLAATQGLTDDAYDAAFSPDGRHLYVLQGFLEGGLVRLQVRVLAYTPVDNAFFLVDTVFEPGRHQSGSELPEIVVDPNGRFVAFTANHERQAVVFGRDPESGELTFLEALQVEQEAFNVQRRHLGLAAGSNGELFVSSEALSQTYLFRRRCVANEPRNLCLGNGRYLAEVDWRTFEDLHGYGRQVEGAPPSDSGLFYFFSDNNWELLVKALDACAINDRVWAFAAGTTNVDYELRISDNWTGKVAKYRQEGFEPIPAVTDTDALDVCLEGLAPPPVEGEVLVEMPSPAVAGVEEVLHLGDFSVRLDWTTPAGLQGKGQVVPFQSADSGLFTSFSPNNWEAQVKVLNGCAINGHYWVFGAAPTNVGFRLTVERAGFPTRSYTNPPGDPAPPIIDVAAFPCSSQAAEKV